MALPVPATLTLPVPLHRFGMGLSILPGIIPMKVSPFPLAISADLAVLGVGFDLAAVVVAAAVPLTVGMTANELVRAKKRGLKRIVAVATAAIAHRAAPDQAASRSL